MEKIVDKNHNFKHSGNWEINYRHSGIFILIGLNYLIYIFIIQQCKQQALVAQLVRAPV